MSRRRRAVRAIALALVLLALASACSSKPPRTQNNTNPVSGGSLRVAVRDLSSLDPAKATGRGALFVLAQVFRPLTTISEDGSPHAGAAQTWSVSANGLVWTFRLATATFHDGTPVTAGSFKAAFDRLALKATGSDAAYQLEPVRGFHAAKIAGTAKALSGVAAKGASTLVITLDRPFGELPRFLAHPALGPIPASALAKPVVFGAQPIGNGPFRVADARTDAGVRLARFDSYAGAKPYVDEVQVTVRTDPESVWTDLTAGHLHVGEVPQGRAEEARRRFGEAGFTPFWAAFYYGLNLRLPKYANLQARKAIALAIDRAALAQDVYGGTKDAATGIIPAGVPGTRAEACDACRFDVAKARAALTAVFKGRPPQMTIDHLDAASSRDLARAVARQLEAAGLLVSLRAHSSADYKKLLQSGKQDIAELGWFSDVPSPDSFLAQQLRTKSPNNPLGLADHELDVAIDKARAVRDDSQRVLAYQAAQDRALELMALIPLVFFRSRTVAGAAVRGFRLDGAGIFDASVVWLAKAE